MTEMVSARALKRDFRQAFEQVDIERLVPQSELVVHGRWAIGIDEVESTRSLEESDGSVDTHFKAVFVRKRQSDYCWMIARVMELSG